MKHAISYYQELMTLCKRSIQKRFWYNEGGYLYDVIDGQNGDDPVLRPNQLLALSLRHSAVTQGQRQSVLEMRIYNALAQMHIASMLSPQR